VNHELLGIGLGKWYIRWSESVVQIIKDAAKWSEVQCRYFTWIEIKWNEVS
jgi:hypothetical protein